MFWLWVFVQRFWFYCGCIGGFVLVLGGGFGLVFSVLFGLVVDGFAVCL